MITKKIIELSGRLDWNWKHGNLQTTKQTIKTLRGLLTKLEGDLPNDKI